MRAIQQVHGNKRSYWVGDGFRVQTLVNHLRPKDDFNYSHTDPFLLLDYGEPTNFSPNPDYDTQPRGIGQHPHKGFETVTIAYAGEISHKDSTGSSGIIREGDVQWMTAGRGITHEEFHSPAFGKQGGMFSMAQMWINLPQQHKLTDAHYQTLKRATLPTSALFADDNSHNDSKNDNVSKQIPIGQATIIAGDLNGINGTARTFTPINVWDIELYTAGTTTLNLPASHNLMILVQSGSLLINDTEVTAGQLVQFEAPNAVQNKEPLTKDAAKETITDTIILTYPEPSNLSDTNTIKLLLLSGEPIGAHGPFVMTTQEELDQIFYDYQNGNFG
ncbi:pirin family protein [Psychrobacter sp. 16-MNA-CIBAN-0192]|uniref:pirin family protein n=1 Tax=Psychrobacter sp. 16-MNA-CIBAN-0192 TaxID=3140448 RepID=UPI00332129AA